MQAFEKARSLLQQFKQGRYLYGEDALAQIGNLGDLAGKKGVFVRSTFPGSDRCVDAIRTALAQAGAQIAGEMEGPRPNAPREDLFQLAQDFKAIPADFLVSFGGGSTIDAAKAAEVLHTLGGEIDAYFGTGLVAKALEESGKQLRPHLAIQTVASSAAHLTKYSNITDLASAQKKLIVDEAIVPQYPVFDYAVNMNAPHGLKADGALDGVSHCLEVLYSAAGKPNYAQVEEIAVNGISLIVSHLPKAMQEPQNTEANEALCLGTDLGGYAIMVGGTNGGHLTSFSLVDILSHGRACAMLNPYYTVFFAPAIEEPLKAVGGVYRQAGLTAANIDTLHGRDLGLAVAEAMFNLAEKIGFPTRLEEVPGFTDAHIARALVAAKDPQLKMKLENMPVPLNAEMVDEYMGPILEAAKTGELSKIKNL